PDLSGPSPHAAAKGEGSDVGTVRADGPLQQAATLTGYPQSALRSDDVANVCGGAALLASYQRTLSPAQTDATAPAAWDAAIAKYSGAADQPTANRFVAQVFSVLRSGQTRTTDDGQQVRLAAHPNAAPDKAAVAGMGLANPSSGHVSCPHGLGCEWVPAPYE